MLTKLTNFYSLMWRCPSEDNQSINEDPSIDRRLSKMLVEKCPCNSPATEK